MSWLHYWYLMTIVFFIGVALYLIWVERKPLIKKHGKFILLFGIFSTPFAYWDSVALSWHAYQYNPATTLHKMVFGGELETYIFMGLVALVVCSATVIYMQEEEIGKLRLRYSSRRRKKMKSRRKKLMPIAGYSRR